MSNSWLAVPVFFTKWLRGSLQVAFYNQQSEHTTDDRQSGHVSISDTYFSALQTARHLANVSEKPTRFFARNTPVLTSERKRLIACNDEKRRGFWRETSVARQSTRQPRKHVVLFIRDCSCVKGLFKGISLSLDWISGT